ncbi:putative adipolin [Apostichopus japonicus]|uniref:Adipolin n=1 Tax=Stichopus japonicus TaxID=307972 RepID=A0A2G8L5G0_STIJA|nr:putative adipolin [Apostichopus japonicus]
MIRAEGRQRVRRGGDGRGSEMERESSNHPHPTPPTHPLNPKENGETPPQTKGRVVDPHESWISFVKHSSKATKEDKKCKNRRKNDRLIGQPGAEGPPGPMGPPGPAEAAERRAQILVYEKCPSCAPNITEATQPWLPEVEDILLMPILPIAFHCKLERDLRISGKVKLEITNYQTTDSSGLFKRGSGLDVTSGRFTAPRSAIYQLSANFHIRHKRPISNVEQGQVSDDAPRPKEYLRLMICINSLCDDHASLEFISGFESSSRIFTVSVSGLLTLEKDQYVSVFIDNKSTQRIYVQSRSDFSGLIMGA